MAKRIIYIESAGKLKVKDQQLVYESQHDEAKTVPIEDIAVLILDNHSLVLTKAILTELCANNAGIIVCDKKHMPSGLMLAYSGNVIFGERLRIQINVSEAKLGNLWKQLIISKIKNQAASLVLAGQKGLKLNALARKVRTGDPDNMEARAAKYYWQNLFGKMFEFSRDKEGEPPNQLFNFGYAILRSVTARAISGAGLNPAIGIHHSNRYNTYALADDLMEPYRPFLDNIIFTLISNGEYFYEMDHSIKEQLLSIPKYVVEMNGKNKQLIDAMQESANSLVSCYSGTIRKLSLPVFADVDQQI